MIVVSIREKQTLIEWNGSSSRSHRVYRPFEQAEQIPGQVQDHEHYQPSFSDAHTYTDRSLKEKNQVLQVSSLVSWRTKLKIAE